MRPYGSERDYQMILEAARACGEISLAAIAAAFEQHGVQWPNLSHRDGIQGAQAIAVDRDILRAWKELGYHPKAR